MPCCTMAPMRAFAMTWAWLPPILPSAAVASRWRHGWRLPGVDACNRETGADARVIQTLTSGMSLGRLQRHRGAAYIGFVGKPPRTTHQEPPPCNPCPATSTRFL